jgi:hypothetical protein
MPSALLPPVDPGFLVSERRPEKLHAYARGLLQHLRRIRDGGKANGYPIATIETAAVWLIESYVDARTAPSHEAAALIREIVQPNPEADTLPVRASSKEAYPAAIEFEATQPPDPAGKSPSIARRYAVAKHILGLLRNETTIKTAESIIREWRKHQYYRANVALGRTEAARAGKS